MVGIIHKETTATKSQERYSHQQAEQARYSRSLVKRGTLNVRGYGENRQRRSSPSLSNNDGAAASSV